jgi:hypothetical protein
MVVLHETPGQSQFAKLVLAVRLHEMPPSVLVGASCQHHNLTQVTRLHLKRHRLLLNIDEKKVLSGPHKNESSQGILAAEVPLVVQLLAFR